MIEDEKPGHPAAGDEAKDASALSDEPRQGLVLLHVRWLSRASRLIRLSWLAIVLLSAAHLGLVLASANGIELHNSVRLLFDLDMEGSIGTWFSSVLLATGGTLAILMFDAEPRRRIARFWLALGVTLWLLSLDETVGLHERSSLGMSGSGWLSSPWVVPGTAFVIALGAVFWLGLLRHLPAMLSQRLVLAAGVYVFGVLAVEFLESAIFAGEFFNTPGIRSVPFRLVALTQEVLEMCGLVLFVVAIVRYWENRFGGVSRSG